MSSYVRLSTATDTVLSENWRHFVMIQLLQGRQTTSVDVLDCPLPSLYAPSVSVKSQQFEEVHAVLQKDGPHFVISIDHTFARAGRTAGRAGPRNRLKSNGPGRKINGPDRTNIIKILKFKPIKHVLTKWPSDLFRSISYRSGPELLIFLKWQQKSSWCEVSEMGRDGPGPK